MSRLQEFAARLKFDYMETWCFPRNPEAAEFIELYRLSQEVKLDADQKKRYTELRILTMEVERDIFADGRMDPEAVLKNKCSFDSPYATRLMEILNIKVVQVNHWMCWPVYRDAVVFYNAQDEVVSVLSICFSCHSLVATGYGFMDADQETYGKLNKLFTELGHGLEYTWP